MEAEGIVSIKIRSKMQRSMMERLDPEMSGLASQMQAAEAGGVSPEERRRLEEAMRKREEVLAPIYHQVKTEPITGLQGNHLVQFSVLYTFSKSFSNFGGQNNVNFVFL